MINTRSKMHRTNQEIRKWFINNNYKDIIFFPHTRWIKDIHFQGLDFNGMCSKGNKLVLFQAKSNKKIPKKILKQYKKISKKFGIICLWINKIDRKGIGAY